ncbi:MAG TPA: AsnC family protein [Pseudonocardiaceae bacterium]|nr:AsnC family protein [Pseudonocardiaceae bacterium]
MTMANAYRLRRGGPSLRARLPVEVKIWQGTEVYVLRYGHRLSFRAIGRQLGISTTTAWRRCWFYQDFVMYPQLRGLPRDHVPPQRGTRECPRGEPPTLVRPAHGYVRHPLPAIRCRAHRRHDGAPCGRWAIRGGAVCPSHGGSAPHVKRAAAERVRRALAMDQALRARFRNRDLRVPDLRAAVLSKRRPWSP